ncbi:MAG: flagellar biosynthesis protein FlhF [Phycisphaerales bacterium]
MNLKTYRAGTMAQALAEVKKDLGKDAVILHTRVHREGALLGLGGKQVVEITASDQAPVRRPRPRTEPESFTPMAFPRGERVAPPAEPHPMAAAAQPVSAAAALRAMAPRAALEVLAPEESTANSGRPGSLPRANRGSSALAVTAPLAPVDAAAASSLHAELASIRRLVGQVLQVTRSGAGSGTVASGGVPDALVSLFATLLDAGVSRELADEVVGGVRDDLTRAELADETVAKLGVKRRLAGLLPVVGAIGPGGRSAEGKPLTIALIGPTGVGKTTTIGKLAAAYKLRQGKRVGLVTCDTYRIAAVEQLRVYAGIIGVPLKVALAPQDVALACAELRDCDVVIVDTPGRGQRDHARLDELGACVKAADPDQTHLVLSTGVAEAVLLAAAERFKIAGPDRLLLTKLDEAVQLGPIVNVVRRAGLPVSYVTTGQEVPDHIELANSDQLAGLVLDGASSPGWGQ